MNSILKKKIDKKTLVQLVRNLLIACMIILDTCYLGNMIKQQPCLEVDIDFMIEYVRLCSIIMADDMVNNRNS